MPRLGNKAAQVTVCSQTNSSWVDKEKPGKTKYLDLIRQRSATEPRSITGNTDTDSTNKWPQGVGPSTEQHQDTKPRPTELVHAGPSLQASTP